MLWGWVIQKLLIDNLYPFWLSQSLPLTFIPILPTLAVDYSYPCWTKQGGEVMQEKTENQIDKNYFVWDTAYYRWKCAATSTSCSNFVLGIVVTTVLQQLWNLMWFVGCGLWNNGVPHDHTKQNRLSMIQKMNKGGDGFQKTSSILQLTSVVCSHPYVPIADRKTCVVHTCTLSKSNAQCSKTSCTVGSWLEHSWGIVFCTYILSLVLVAESWYLVCVHRSTPSCVVCGTCTRTVPHTHQGSARRN